MDSVAPAMIGKMTSPITVVIAPALCRRVAPTARLMIRKPPARQRTGQ